MCGSYLVTYTKNQEGFDFWCYRLQGFFASDLGGSEKGHIYYSELGLCQWSETFPLVEKTVIPPSLKVVANEIH